MNTVIAILAVLLLASACTPQSVRDTAQTPQVAQLPGAAPQPPIARPTGNTPVDQGIRNCESRKDTYLLTECYQDVALRFNDSAPCMYIPGDTGKDDCYWTLGRQIKEQGICEKVIRPDKKNACLGPVMKDPTFCPRILDADLKDFCYGETARTKIDVALCTDIQNDNAHTNCIVDIAGLIDQPTLCDSLGRWKELCYLSVARETSNPALCVNIQDANIRNQCQTSARK